MKITITTEASTQEELFKRMDEIKSAVKNDFFEELMDGSIKINNSSLELDHDWDDQFWTCL